MQCPPLSSSQPAQLCQISDPWPDWYRLHAYCPSFGNFNFKSCFLNLTFDMAGTAPKFLETSVSSRMFSIENLWYDFNFIVNFPFLSERHVRHDCPFCPYPSHSLNVALVEVLAVFPRCWYWRMFLHLLKLFTESERDYAGGAMVGCQRTRCRSEDGEWCS